MKSLNYLMLITVLFICSCSVTSTSTENISINKLQLLDEYDVPFNKPFNNTIIGGLSGIDYDKKHDQYYMICDDRSAINPARFYTAKIILNGKKIDSVHFTTVTRLLQPDGKTYPNSKEDPYHTPDPESMRYNAKTNDLVWTSEGERIVNAVKVVLEDPSIYIIDRDGHYKDSFLLPANLHMHASENGPRQNGVFEGSAFSNDFKTLYVNVEEPIYEDGPRAGTGDSTGWIRIVKFDVASRKPVAQYAYQIDPVAYPAIPGDAFKINGIPDIIYLGKDKLLVIERSFSTGRIPCTIRVYLADLTKATDVQSITSLRRSSFTPASKKLLLNMDSLGIYTDNIEGVTFGPKLPDGHQSLIFISDNNFSPLEKTQFLLFEIL